MASVMKNSSGPLFGPPLGSINRTQLRRDRWTAVAVVAIVVAMMAAIVWLASLSGGGAYSIEHWPIMA